MTVRGRKKSSLESPSFVLEGFRAQAGERKPLEGGLNAVQLLGLFNLSNAISYLFADRFSRLFWLHRTQDRGVEIGFEEFVRVLSLWTRGNNPGPTLSPLAVSESLLKEPARGADSSHTKELAWGVPLVRQAEGTSSIFSSASFFADLPAHSHNGRTAIPLRLGIMCPRRPSGPE